VDKQREVSSTLATNSGARGTKQDSPRTNLSSAGADFKAIVRPLITAFLVIGAIGCIWAEITPPDWYLGMTGTAFVWWFGSRELEKRNK